MMALDILPRCPVCDLVLLCGSITDSADWKAKYGPVLGLHREATKESAQAGYVGISSLFAPELFRVFYQCPRCRADPVVEVPEERSPEP
jgi:hypothetical protein